MNNQDKHVKSPKENVVQKSERTDANKFQQYLKTFL